MPARHGRGIRGLRVRRHCRGIKALGDAIARCIGRLGLIVLDDDELLENWKLGHFLSMTSGPAFRSALYKVWQQLSISDCLNCI